MDKHSKYFFLAAAALAGLLMGSIFWMRPDQRGEQKNPALNAENNIIEAVDIGNTAEIMAQELKIPWELVFLPDGGMLVTERPGNLKKLGEGGFSINVPGAVQSGEGGLLGMALHPDYEKNKWIYLYFTSFSGGATRNVVERFVLSGSDLTEGRIIIDDIPAASNHDGGRIAFGPDGYLYIATGDAGKSELAQDTNSLAGKILRIKDDGSIPESNPFLNAVYSYGHRNVQGITWDESGQLWATEHGRSGVLSGYDELNLIEPGANYGWPLIQGDETRDGMKVSSVHSGATDTWAPSGAAYLDGSIFFAGLRGEAVYEYNISEKKLVEHFKGEYGRIREVSVGPEGNLFFLTNNTDGRGSPRKQDDKIIKIPRL